MVMNRENQNNQNYKCGSVRSFDKSWKETDAIYVDRLEKAKKFRELCDVIKFEYLSCIFPKISNVKSLECGSGSAVMSLYFAKKGYNVTMLDASREAIDLAKRLFELNGATGQFLNGDVYKMKFPDNTFDIVMSCGLLEHFEDVETVIKEMVRVLKPGSIFYAGIIPKRFSVQKVADVMFNSLVAFVFFIGKGKIKKALKSAFNIIISKKDYYENSYTVEEYKHFFKRAGLKDVVIVGDNPYPALNLPLPLEQMYVWVLKKFGMGIWRKFNSSNSWFSNIFWCNSWRARGIK